MMNGNGNHKTVCFLFEESDKSARHSLKSIAEIFYRFTPQIALAEYENAQAVFLEITQCGSLYTDEEFLKNAEEIFQNLSITFSVGQGPNAMASFLQASLGTHDLRRVPLEFLSIFLNPFQKPDVEQKTALEKMQWYLKKLAVESIFDFAVMNPKQLSSRFGSLGSLLHGRVQGYSGVIWPLFVPEEKVVEWQDFDTEFTVTSSEPMLFILKRLLDVVHLRLQARGLALKKFDLNFIQEKNSVVQNRVYKIPIELSFTQISSKTVLQLVHERVQHALRVKPFSSPISAVEIEVTDTNPYVEVQKDLFHPKREEIQETYLSLANRLALKLGAQNVFHAQLRESYLPEKNWERAQKDFSKTFAVPQSDPLPRRPLRIFETPTPVPCLDSHLVIEPAMREAHGDKSHDQVDLHGASGQEVVLSNWWDQNAQRIYFQAVSKKGRRFWLFKSAEKYFLHGVFD